MSPIYINTNKNLNRKKNRCYQIYIYAPKRSLIGLVIDQWQ